MKKKIIILTTTTILSIGIVSAAYARDNNRTNAYASRGLMMYQNNASSYNKMIELMKSNGFETAADAMMNSVNRQQMVNIHNSMMGW